MYLESLGDVDENVGPSLVRAKAPGEESGWQEADESGENRHEGSKAEISDSPDLSRIGHVPAMLIGEKPCSDCE